MRPLRPPGQSGQNRRLAKNSGGFYASISMPEPAGSAVSSKTHTAALAAHRKNRADANPTFFFSR